MIHPHIALLRRYLDLNPIGRFRAEEVRTSSMRILPYAIGSSGDGKYILLNRFYKPLGIRDELGDFVRYEQLPDSIKISKETAERIAPMLEWDEDRRWPGYLHSKRRAIESSVLAQEIYKVLTNG